jgi:hypothetical protein
VIVLILEAQAVEVLEMAIWLPTAVGAAGALLVVIARCVTLLIGLFAVLPKTSRADRVDIFREFARALNSDVRRHKLPDSRNTMRRSE